ncbi:uncharacterized protein LOC120485674 isoform X1 [Pimephales promelas]|uniref:uncharacterized protein LOC120461489 isoform X1 n=2 Tax=Pimephales promelas TaxID=90988 RepID=UPI001955EDDE|nr:uncharacterized protein LOC120461489 isoform X1 [Pimephales promelas]XP_039507505.1 uncharacterized protein LOC120462869 isoform X1 [Pimephales promelas]XP_039529505.1 uncharacterized protein LOC120480428 isoform X1 [Pimephales promelas]XP_039537453.1 uncharacterized protein LOC120485674 isoform X1 [Pimephales promelas]
MFKLCSARPRARHRGGDLALDMLETHVIPGGRVVDMSRFFIRHRYFFRLKAKCSVAIVHFHICSKTQATGFIIGKLKAKCSAAFVHFHICSAHMQCFIIGKQTTDLTTYGSAVLRGLPLYMREPASISKTIKNTEALGPHTKAMKMGILEVTDSSTNSGPYSTVVNVAVVLEEEVVMDNLEDFTNALVMLFGLLYAVKWSKDLRYTFEAVQKIILNCCSGTC